MNIFEGYVGIRLWDGQLVDDVIFSLLLFLFVAFSFVFRTNFQLFVKMLKDAFLVKERQNLFDDVIGKSIFFFRNFMTFQVLFLSSIALIAVGRIYGFVNYAEWQAVLSAIGTVFCVLFIGSSPRHCNFPPDRLNEAFGVGLGKINPRAGLRHMFQIMGIGILQQNHLG